MVNSIMPYWCHWIFFTVQSSLSVASSLKSENLHLPDDNVYSKYDDAITGMDEDLDTVMGAGVTDEKSPALSTGTVGKILKSA